MSIKLLRELRSLKVVVVHPPDDEGRVLMAQLQRIGCAASQVWPVPPATPANADVVFVLLDEEFRSGGGRMLKAMPPQAPTLIAILSYEDPGTLQVIVDSDVMAVLHKPIKPFGVLASLMVARNAWNGRLALTKENRKLRRKIVSDQAMSRAKTILMASRNLDEESAYQAIREQAMARRVSMDEIAHSIINMEKLLKANPD